MSKQTKLLSLGLLIVVCNASNSQIIEHRRVQIAPPNSQLLALAQAAQSALYAGQYSLAEADARQSSLADNLGRTQDVLASALVAQGKILEASSIYAEIDRSGSDNPAELLPYALLLLKSGQWAQALKVYNSALPHVGSPLIDGHDLLVQDGDYSAGSPEPAALETDIHIALGFTGVDDYGIAGPTTRDRSVAEYLQALKISPDSPLANLAYGNGLKEDGRRTDADVVYRDVITKYSGDVKIAAEKETGEYYRTPEYQAAAAAAAKAGQPAP